MNLKLCDFGFSTYKSIRKLTGYLGTVNYMAPEIHMGLYDGVKTDIFAAAVTLFIMVKGSLPFKLADKDDPFYGLIC